MTDKEKTIKELKEALDSLDITNKYRLNIIRAIEYLQEEPVSDSQPLAMFYGLTGNVGNTKEEPVSEDLEKAAKDYSNNLDNIYGSIGKQKRNAFKAGAKWQKEKDESITEDLEKASKEWLQPQLDKSYANYGEAKMTELTHFNGYAMLDAIEFGANWQKAKDQHAIELAEDHAMLAGMEKMKEEMKAKAIDAHCFGFQGAALFSFRLPASNYLVGSEVKIIVINKQ